MNSGNSDDDELRAVIERNERQLDALRGVLVYAIRGHAPAPRTRWQRFKDWFSEPSDWFLYLGFGVFIAGAAGGVMLFMYGMFSLVGVSR